MRIRSIIVRTVISLMGLSLPAFADQADDLQKELQMAKDRAELERQKAQSLYEQLKLIKDTQALASAKDGSAVTNEKLPDMLATRAFAWLAADEVARHFCSQPHFVDFKKNLASPPLYTTIEDPLGKAEKAEITLRRLETLDKSAAAAVSSATNANIMSGAEILLIIAGASYIASEIRNFRQSNYEILSKSQDVPKFEILKARCGIFALTPESILMTTRYSDKQSKVIEPLYTRMLGTSSRIVQILGAKKPENYTARDTALKANLAELTTALTALRDPDTVVGLASGLALKEEISSNRRLVAVDLRAENVQIHKAGWLSSHKSLATGWMSMSSIGRPEDSNPYYAVATRSIDAKKLDFDHMSEMNVSWPTAEQPAK